MYTSTGAPAVAGQCYYCYATDYWTNCPSGTTFRADYFTYDDCCYPRACTSVGDCSYSSDGECDDGGEGSEYGSCSYASVALTAAHVRLALLRHLTATHLTATALTVILLTATALTVTLLTATALTVILLRYVPMDIHANVPLGHHARIL